MFFNHVLSFSAYGFELNLPIHPLSVEVQVYVYSCIIHTINTENSFEQFFCRVFQGPYSPVYNIKLEFIGTILRHVHERVQKLE